MSDIGPALPPHLLAKRKRQQEQREAESKSIVESSSSKTSNTENNAEKRRRVIGPSLPPKASPPSQDASSLDRESQIPNPQSKVSISLLNHAKSNSENDSSDDDDFGPAPPTTALSISSTNGNPNPSISPPSPPDQGSKPKRDDWMTLAPSADGLTRLDPARPRPRAFNTSKGARGPNDSNQAATSLWNETPEQKRQRLQDEMMGIATKPSEPVGSATGKQSKKKDDAEQKRIRDQVNQSRGPSLMDQHQSRNGATAADDDPSQRSFDREKDMGSGMKIGQSQRRQFLDKAASSVSSKFAGGGYL